MRVETPLLEEQEEANDIEENIQEVRHVRNFENQRIIIFELKRRWMSVLLTVLDFVVGIARL